MELKRAWLSSLQLVVLYQSNLYGIETAKQTDGNAFAACINRTFMELKRKCPEQTRSHISGINRTFMELKLRTQTEQDAQKRGINRTFMELKLTDDRRNRQTKTVSIEPLWNWNSPNSTIQDWTVGYQSNLYGIETLPNSTPRKAKACINRTFMELKPCWLLPTIPQSLCINRTFMELKHYSRKHNDGESRRINRTFMELKQHKHAPAWKGRVYQSNLYGIETPVIFSPLLLLFVSIEPLWNWNSFGLFYLVILFRINRTFMDLKQRHAFKSSHGQNCINRTFMELKPGATSRVRSLLLRINRTFMELKRASAWVLWRVGSVSIEPLWNWNWGVRTQRNRQDRINRTFIRPPQGTRGHPVPVSIEPLWNWNDVGRVGGACDPGVSIEPLWNWNVCCKNDSAPTVLYQSNLYGIETRSRAMLLC